MLSAEEQETWLALGPFQGACQEARGPDAEGRTTPTFGVFVFNGGVGAL